MSSVEIPVYFYPSVDGMLPHLEKVTSDLARKAEREANDILSGAEEWLGDMSVYKKNWDISVQSYTSLSINYKDDYSNKYFDIDLSDGYRVLTKSGSPYIELHLSFSIYFINVDSDQPDDYLRGILRKAGLPLDYLKAFKILEKNGYDKLTSKLHKKIFYYLKAYYEAYRILKDGINEDAYKILFSKIDRNNFFTKKIAADVSSSISDYYKEEEIVDVDVQVHKDKMEVESGGQDKNYDSFYYYFEAKMPIDIKVKLEYDREDIEKKIKTFVSFMVEKYPYIIASAWSITSGSKYFDARKSLSAYKDRMRALEQELARELKGHTEVKVEARDEGIEVFVSSPSMERILRKVAKKFKIRGDYIRSIEAKSKGYDSSWVYYSILHSLQRVFKSEGISFQEKDIEVFSTTPDNIITFRGGISL